MYLQGWRPPNEFLEQRCEKARKVIQDQKYTGMRQTVVGVTGTVDIFVQVRLAVLSPVAALSICYWNCHRYGRSVLGLLGRHKTARCSRFRHAPADCLDPNASSPVVQAVEKSRNLMCNRRE